MTFGLRPFAKDALLFLLQQREGDRVGIVRFQELLFLCCQSAKTLTLSVDRVLVLSASEIEQGRDVSADLGHFGVVQPDVSPVALNVCLDLLHRQVREGAVVRVVGSPAQAEEVRVDRASA